MDEIKKYSGKRCMPLSAMEVLLPSHFSISYSQFPNRERAPYRAILSQQISRTVYWQNAGNRMNIRVRDLAFLSFPFDVSTLYRAHCLADGLQPFLEHLHLYQHIPFEHAQICSHTTPTKLRGWKPLRLVFFNMRRQHYSTTRSLEMLSSAEKFECKGEYLVE